MATSGNVKGADGLTDKQRLFVQEFLVDMNATQAAIRTGYSPKTANEQASRLLANVNVRALVEKGLEARSRKLEIDAAWVLTRLVREAEADLADLIDEDTGGVREVHDWPMEWRQGLVAGIEVQEEYDDVEEPDTMQPQGHGGALRRPAKRRVAVGRVVKLKFADRHKKLEAIGRHVNVNAWKLIEGAATPYDGGSLMDAVGGTGIRPRLEHAE